ncbi:hypothetical protein [Pseudovibrio sp. WM33]|uniref:hypothetical protein n=1 Tax=Pseudovibrio sp. WM33 TaxID=1735585 RepID=UPI0007AE9344|nr:hypothetical protein [Pseudovibrio sp. WM33]KZL24686.1 hypothetical protein PsWM33_02360 [Pseudovibrio sp. WM33]
MLEVLRSTPHWVYTLYTVVLYFGLASCFEKRSRLYHLLSTPIIIVVISLVLVTYYSGFSLPVLGGWTLGILIATALVYWFPQAPRLRREGDLIITPGGLSVLGVSGAGFFTKYWLGYASASGADWTQLPSFLMWDSMTSGLIVGFFVGRGLSHFTIAKQLEAVSDGRSSHDNC